MDRISLTRSYRWRNRHDQAEASEGAEACERSNCPPSLVDIVGRAIRQMQKHMGEKSAVMIAASRTGSAESNIFIVWAVGGAVMSGLEPVPTRSAGNLRARSGARMRRWRRKLSQSAQVDAVTLFSTVEQDAYAQG